MTVYRSSLFVDKIVSMICPHHSENIKSNLTKTSFNPLVAKSLKRDFGWIRYVLGITKNIFVIQRLK